MRRAFVSAVLLTVGFVAMTDAQELPTPPVLREAQPGEVWITRPTMSAELPIPASEQGGVRTLAIDSTPPTAPGNLVAQSTGLFLISADWSPSTDPESAIDYYAFALGTGTTPGTEANVRWWQSNSRNTKVKINVALTPGATYYFSVRARNVAGQYSVVTRSGPLTATPATYGQAGNQITYVISPVGIDASGGETSSYPPDQLAALTDFVDKMLPVLRDLYGPPSSTYMPTIVRDLRYTSSAVFFPSTDEIHVGDTITYQLLTHEMVHAWRRDQCLSSGSVWQYEPTLSGFEEGFAQAVSYQAMTEFARRYPGFGLSQKIYQSSHEWDYDFQNVPNLRTKDFWSDSGGMNLHWVRYEMAAAAIRKIELEHPGFYRAFNAEYYRRLNLDPRLTTSRSLVKDIIQTVAPTIEGKPASQWIDAQYVFDCAFHPGKKIWLKTNLNTWQYYNEYSIDNVPFFYETFSNGSDWAYPDGAGGYTYHHLNGSAGTATLRTSSGDVVWQGALLTTPVENPPVYFGFGYDYVNLTTQPPWPGGDPATFVTNLLPFDLYRLTIEFTAGTTVTNDSYQVIGAPLRNSAGVFGGVVGGNGGRIYLNHRQHPPQPPASVENDVFWMRPQWASLSHPATGSVDTTPGVVDVTYVDAAGNIYKDVRTIEYGSWSGSQAFLFDVAHMTPAASAAPEAASIVALTSPAEMTASSSGRTFQVGWTASGGTGNATLASDSSWLSVQCGTGGTPDTIGPNACTTADGPGAYGRTVIVGAASSAQPRTGRVTLTGSNGGNTVTVVVTQLGAAATFTVSPSAWEAPVGGGTQTVSVTSSLSHASWTATSDAVWLTLSPPSGTGTGTVTLTAAALSSAAARTATVTIAGHSVTVTQVGSTSSVTPVGSTSIVDIVWRNTETGDVAGWLMNGLTLTQGEIVNAGLPAAWQIQGVGDLDADGKTDLVFRNMETGDVAAWLMNGLTLTQGEILNAGLPAAWQIQGLGDLDADGKADLVFRNTETGDVAAWLMNGLTVTQGGIVNAGLPAAWQIQGLGDLDADGTADLVFRNTETGDVAAWLMNGLTVTQGEIINAGLPAAWQIQGLGDLDDDGKADLVFRNTETGDVAAWLMNGMTVTQGEIINAGLPAAWQIQGLGDLDADGKADLVFRNTETGDVAAWLMNGLTVTQGEIIFAGLPAAWQIQGLGDLNGK